jgi:hypothetical protein
MQSSCSCPSFSLLFASFSWNPTHCTSHHISMSKLLFWNPNWQLLWKLKGSSCLKDLPVMNPQNFFSEFITFNICSLGEWNVQEVC